MKLIACLLLALSLNTFAQTTEADALSLFNDRGTDSKNATKAANIYKSIANSTTDVLVKADLLSKASMGYFYHGTMISGKDAKKNTFAKGMNLANEAMSLLDTKNPSHLKTKAIAWYRYGSNLGKWAEANGVVSSLSKWPKLKKYMNYIIKAKMGATESYGAFRILGKAYYKLPSPMGSKSKSLKYLKHAFDKTLHSVHNTISAYGSNTIYLAELYIATGKKAEAKKMLETFVSVNPETFNTERVPETKAEMAEAKVLLNNL